MCSYALAKAGINVRVIDKRPSHVSAGQADGLQPRTLEVLQSYGLADPILEQACQMHMIAFWNPGKDGGLERTGQRPDAGNPKACRFPFEATLHQQAIEGIFYDKMKKVGISVDRPVHPTCLEISRDEQALKDPHAYPVKVLLEHLEPAAGQDEKEIVHAKFIVGGDGAHSWVRKTLGIAMEGEQTELIWGVVDLIPVTDFPDIRTHCAIHSNNGSMMVIPREGEMVRLYMQLTDKDVLDPVTGRVDRTKMGPDQLLDVARKSLHPWKLFTPKHIDWSTVYIIGQRVASQYSVQERVFIIGDACHTHSPKAGQGMNASINDSHNIAWKITQVLRGWADLSLLKTYESERRKYAQDLINFDRKFSALFSDKPQTQEYADGISPEEFNQAFNTFGAFMSGLGIYYGASALVNTKYQSFAKNLIIGQRMHPQILLRAADARPYELQDLLPSDTRFKVLIFVGDPTIPAQKTRLEKLVEEMSRPESFLKKYTRGKERDEIFDVLAISSGTKEHVNYTAVPEFFRSHWSKVLLDDTDMTGLRGGKAYESFGIEPSGAVVIVRPDGYVSFISPFEAIQEADTYFAAFMKAPL